MIQWLIDHYVVIAVYSGIASAAIGVVAIIAFAVIRHKEKKEWKEYLKNRKKK